MQKEFFRGQHLRYYYDSSQDTCNQFSYGGCAGNANNFLSVSDCEDTCRSSSSNSKKVDSEFLDVSISKDIFLKALKAETTKKALVRKTFRIINSLDQLNYDNRNLQPKEKIFAR